MENESARIGPSRETEAGDHLKGVSRLPCRHSNWPISSPMPSRLSERGEIVRKVIVALVAQRVLPGQGLGAWPYCATTLGLLSASGVRGAGLADDWLRNAAAVSVSPVSARGVPLVDEPTDPIGPPDADGGPQRQDDFTAESTEPAADEESRRAFSHRIGRCAILLSLACVAALLVGFGSVTVLLRLGDRPAQSDTQPVPTTAAPVAQPAAAPAVTTPPAPAPSGPAVESDPVPAPPAPAPPAPAPPPRAEASESPAPPSSSSPTTTVTTTPNTKSPSPDPQSPGPDGATVTPGPE